MRKMAWAIVTGLIALTLSSAAGAMTTAQARLLCVQVSGGDFSEPGSMAAFQRCMHARNPVAAMRRNVIPPRHRIPGLVAQHQVALVAHPGTALTAAGRGGACRQGYVWREATPNDHVCVTPAVRAQVHGRR